MGEPAVLDTPATCVADVDVRHGVCRCQLDADANPAGWPIYALCGTTVTRKIPPATPAVMCEQCAAAWHAHRPCPVCQIPPNPGKADR